MKNNYYSKYNFKELAEVYQTTILNYAKIDGDLLYEINNRGGETSFKERIEKEKQLNKERHRIFIEVSNLTTPNIDGEFIKKLISSDVFSKSETDQIIDEAIYSTKKYKDNKTITSRTIFGCLIGGFIGYALGLVILYFELIFLPELFILGLIIIYAITYLIIRLITKQNASNGLVFISALIATALTLCTFLLVLKNT